MLFSYEKNLKKFISSNGLIPIIDSNDQCKLIYVFSGFLAFVEPPLAKVIWDDFIEEYYHEDMNKFIDYINNVYFDMYDPYDWNYFTLLRHLTNNFCESYNKKFKSETQNSESFYKLISYFNFQEKYYNKMFLQYSNGAIEKEIDNYYSFIINNITNKKRFMNLIQSF